MRRLLLVATLSLTLAGCGGGNTLTGQVSEVADGRLCVQTATDAGVCLMATAQQLGGVKVGACVEVTFSGGGDGVQPVAGKIAARKPPCVTQTR